MKTVNKQVVTILRILISLLFLVSALAKLYPVPIIGITKIFEEGQLIPMGFSSDLAPYVSRIIIGIEFFIAIAILQKNYITFFNWTNFSFYNSSFISIFYWR